MYPPIQIKDRFSKQKGQIAISILLIMIVLMTVGLSIATRTTQDMLISQQQAESVRVFHGAESGIEEALGLDFETITDSISLETIEGIDGVDVSYSVSVNNNLRTHLIPGEAVSVRLKKVDQAGSNGTLAINWGESNNFQSSLIITVYAQQNSADPNTAYISRHFGVCQSESGFCPDSGAQNFFAVSNLGELGFNRKYDLNFTSDDVLVRIMAIHNSTGLLVSGANLPQQHIITSTGLNTLNAQAQSQEQSKIQVTRDLPSAPSFMDFSLYSAGSIVKN